MIQLVQIRGESYDLETGSRSSKALVISNGVRTLDIPASDELVEQVLKMLVESAEQEEPTRASPVVSMTFEPEQSEPVRLPVRAPEPDEDDYADELTGVGSI